MVGELSSMFMLSMFSSISKVSSWTSQEVLVFFRRLGHRHEQMFPMNFKYISKFKCSLNLTLTILFNLVLLCLDNYKVMQFLYSRQQSEFDKRAFHIGVLSENFIIHYQSTISKYQMEQKQEIALIVKVVFQKAVFNLGKNIKTFSDLIAQLKNRFSDLQNFDLNFKQTPVTSQNFDEIFTAQLNEGQSSIKLQLNELPVQKISGLKVQKSKTFAFDPKEFEDDKQQQKKSTKQKDLESEFQELKIEEAEQIQSIDLDTIKIKVLMGDSLSNLKKEVGEEYKWSCTFINQTSNEVPEGVYVREIWTNKLISLGGMGGKQAEQIDFGPYTEKEIGKFTKFFQLVYKKDEKTIVPMGTKFGFVCEAIRKLDVKELSSKVYKKINELKSFCVCEKSNEYIMARFKEMGIDDFTIRQYSGQDLIDMMESFNVTE